MAGRFQPPRTVKMPTDENGGPEVTVRVDDGQVGGDVRSVRFASLPEARPAPREGL
jgi:hypothetical protein